METLKKLTRIFSVTIIIFVFSISARAQTDSVRIIATGPFQPTWESFEKNYQCPEWFRDAKFGIWAHWTAQCVPEQGDWYARQMYIQGSKQNKFHVEHYGHPSKFGFMELDNLWKAENWDPEKLMELYKKAGAKYFVTLANHHDNFDNYNSKYHQWNSVNVGPKKDIVGTWEKIARKNGMYFGVSNHSAHAWHWLQTAYGYDAEGPLAGVRYDAATLTKADGKGKWWEGLDPQELYTGPNMKTPDGITSIKELTHWHDSITGAWTEKVPVQNPNFTNTWFLRCQDLIDKYHPDLIYFDDYSLPLEKAGTDIVAHYYNSSIKWNNGKIQTVVTAKELKPGQNAGIVEDFERGYCDTTKAYPWQTCTCIGDWHYKRELFTKNKYKSVRRVVHQLIDIVSKNGNLLLSIPMRGDGTIDSLEVVFLEDMGKWMSVNGEAIYGTRPWKTFGEGPTQIKAGMFNEGNIKFTDKDVRFTAKGDVLYAFIMGWPADSISTIKSLASSSPFLEGRRISNVQLLGSNERIIWSQNKEGLVVKMPGNQPCEHAVVLKIEGALK